MVEREAVGRTAEFEGERQGPHVMGLSPGGVSSQDWTGQVERHVGGTVRGYDWLGWHYPTHEGNNRLKGGGGTSPLSARCCGRSSFGAFRVMTPAIPMKRSYQLLCSGQRFRGRS